MEKQDKIIYLDHAATTPVSLEVYEAIRPFWQEQYGNPGGVYGMSVAAKKAVNQSRRSIASVIGADSSEIFFTSGGTEADNWALTGSVFAEGFRQGRQVLCQNGNPAKPECAPHVILSAMEHHAVLETGVFLKKMGVDVTYLQPDASGLISCDALKKAMRPETILVSVMTANNEIGTIQPVRELAGVTHEGNCLFHTDAVQAVGHMEINVKELGVDMLSASAHKFGGPKGVGFLYVRQGVVLEPLLHGGGQERGRRAGTENVASIVGMAKALQMKEDTCAVRALRDYMAERIQNEIADVIINGSMEYRLAGNLNVGFAGVESESVLLHLSRHGICASGGAACTTSLKDASHVLRALGQTEEQARSAVRFTLGDDNTMEEIDDTVDILKHVVEELRALRTAQ